MFYAMLCYHRESVVCEWSRDKEAEVMEHHGKSLEGLAAKGRLGPVARLMPTTTAVTLRTGKDYVVLDGPFAETKEQLLGFYVVDCDSLEQAIEAGKGLVTEGGALEIRPVDLYRPPAAGK